MTRIKIIAGALLAAAVAIPAVSMAQDERHDDRRAEQHMDNRGAGPDHAWHRGDRLPDAYRGNQYVVSDWQSHHLHQPPAGYHWVNVNGDFVLAAIATGVITDMLLNN